MWLIKKLSTGSHFIHNFLSVSKGRNYNLNTFITNLKFSSLPPHASIESFDLHCSKIDLNIAATISYSWYIGVDIITILIKIIIEHPLRLSLAIFYRRFGAAKGFFGEAKGLL